MEWTGEKIRQLRRRMGWSQSDLARRLSCESGAVEAWEKNSAEPSDNVSQLLEILFNQAELAAYDITQGCMSEKHLLEQNLESIDLRDIASSVD